MEFELPPKILYWVCVETGLDILLKEPLLGDPGCVLRVIVMLEAPASTHLQCSN